MRLFPAQACLISIVSAGHNRQYCRITVYYRRNGLSFVPTNQSLQQNKAEEAALVRLIVEAIASSVLEQRIIYASDSRRFTELPQNATGQGFPIRPSDT